MILVRKVLIIYALKLFLRCLFFFVTTKDYKPRRGGMCGVLNNTTEIEITKAAVAEKEAAMLPKN